MKDWKRSLRDGIVSGSVASITSTAVLAAASRIETGHAPATLNATSHWVWGDGAAEVDDATASHTGLGMLIHHAASIFWAVLYEKTAGDAVERGSIGAAIAAGYAGAAFACFVDYLCVPRRLTPGFELRLSRPSIAAGYVAFGAGLAITSLLRSGRRRRDDALHRPRSRSGGAACEPAACRPAARRIPPAVGAQPAARIGRSLDSDTIASSGPRS